ncbi:MAG TPA: hypothetical protein VIT45_16100 [Allosphingosinicella sp.]
MSRLSPRLASRLLIAASNLLPNHLSPWARAMERELAEIEDDRSALLFAAGCLRAICGLAIAERLGSPRAAIRRLPFPPPSTWRISAMKLVPTRPRTLALVCGAGAVGLGMAYMAAAGAPSRYLIVNLAALILGASLWLALGRAAGTGPRQPGAMILALAATLVLTAFFGMAADGATRWVSVGPLNVQVSLVVLPVMILLYSREPQGIGTAGMGAAALALALQPDRAMAGVLAAGLIALLLARPGRLPLVAAGSAVAAFAWTMIVPNTLPASPYVDRILFTAFDIHPLAGLAVVAGAAALAAPALAALRGGTDERPALIAFGACWAAVVAAAAFGNNPTPLVGYGGSAILGYLLSGALLPGGAVPAAGRKRSGARAAGGDRADPGSSELSVPNLA